MFIIEANTFGEREDAAAYFIEGDREELELFRFYTLSLALSAMIGPKETRKLHENLRSPKELVTNSSAEQFQDLFTDEQAMAEQKHRRLYQDATSRQLTISYEQELTLLEEGLRLSKVWVNRQGYASKLVSENTITSLNPLLHTYEPAESLGLRPGYSSYAEALSQNDATHIVEQYRFTDPSVPLFRDRLQSPTPDVTYGGLDDNGEFRSVLRIPHECFLTD